jgi:hypothetical protein
MRYAVIPTRNRPGDLADCVAAIWPQTDEIIIIDNGDPAVDPGGGYRSAPEATLVIGEPTQPPNLSRLWNLGLRACHDNYTGQRPAGMNTWQIAVLNDDAIVPDGWMDACCDALAETGAAAACSDPYGILTEPLVHTEPGPVDLRTRLCGWAFVLRGETGLLADEDLRWWYGDDMLDWRARELGGTVVIPGYPVQHRYPNASTTASPALAAQAALDRETFIAKWGQAPW